MKAPALRRSVWVLLAVNALFIGAIFYLSSRVVMRVRMPGAASGRPVLATLSPFTLIRESGREFGSTQLEGRPWVASFIFTRCAGQCPILSGKLASLQPQLPEGARIVSFSVDPAYDSPAKLDEYAKRYGADPERWVHLTGDSGTLQRIQNELKLGAVEDPGMHSLRFILIDGLRQARGFYDSTEPAQIEQLKLDMRKLVGA